MSPLRRIVNICAKVFIVFVFANAILLTIFPTPSGYSPAIRSACMQNARMIGVYLSQYAIDHDGHYPEGSTSTEVFQQLIDGKYVTDPNTFFNSWTPGKIRPLSDHLKSENVCWDVSCCIDSSTYQAGASAQRILPIPPPRPPENWSERLWGVWVPRPFIAVCYRNNSAAAILTEKDGSIPNFIPADFDPKGKTYRQFTP